MDIEFAQRRIQEIIANTISGNLPDGHGVIASSTISDGGRLYTILTGSRHESATPKLPFGLNLAFIMPEREWSKFCVADDDEQKRLLHCFEQTITGRLAKAFTYWQDEVDLGVLAQKESGPITAMEFDDFGQ